MANTTTYSFSLPTVGGSEDSWGASLNGNWTSLDAILSGGTAIAPNLVGWEVGGVAVTATAAQLNYSVGVTSAIQTQIDGKQPLDTGLTSIAGLTTAADRMIYTTAADVYAVTTLTSFSRTLLDDTTATAWLTTLGVGSGFQAAGASWGGDLDDLAASGVYYTGTSNANLPGTAANHALWHSEVTASLAAQIAIDLATNIPYTRAQAGGTWSDWRSMASVGINQTWQTPTRARDTTYQNTTGRPIMVNIAVDSGGYLLVEAANPPTVTVAESPSTRNNLSVIIPPDHYYRVESGTPSLWAELR